MADEGRVREVEISRLRGELRAQTEAALAQANELQQMRLERDRYLGELQAAPSPAVRERQM